MRFASLIIATTIATATIAAPAFAADTTPKGVIAAALKRGHLNCPGQPARIHLTEDWKVVKALEPNTTQDACDKYGRWFSMRTYDTPRWGAKVGIGYDKKGNWHWFSYDASGRLVGKGVN